MSYEGHVQALCKEGHLNEYDCRYNDVNHDLDCFCGAQIIWENNVDDTNCESYGEIDMGQFKIKDAVIDECPTCHHQKIIADEVYRIPTEEERQKARCHRPGYGGTPLVPII